MSTDSIHFLKITGKLAADVEAVCEKIHQHRPNSDNIVSSHQWPLRERKRIDRLAGALLETARSLPIIAYSQYVTWAMGNPADGHLDWPPDLHRHIRSVGSGIAWYASRDWPRVLHVLRRELRRKRPRSPTYIRHLQMIIADHDWVTTPGLIVVICECLGPSREDDQVNAAANARLAPLLKATAVPNYEKVDGRRVAGLTRRLQRIARELSR